MTPSLIAILLAFFAIMVGVLVFCLRERKRALLQRIVNRSRDEDDDNRVAVVIFGAIIVGAMLALVTAYVVFFRQWS